MAKAEDLRRIALSLPGVSEAPHFDRLAFRAARIFTTLAADRRSANIKFSPDEQQLKCIVAPEAFTPLKGGWGARGWTRAELSALDEAELRAAVEAAWRNGQPKTRTPPKRGRR
jgi:YjbR